MPKHYHFCGICGTAMASLAVLLKKQGFKVSGSDSQVYPPMSTYLEQQGIQLNFHYAAEHLNPHPDYVIVGNTLSRGNVEVEYTLENRLHYLSLPELLKNQFIRGRKPVVISGTHGKTTTTALTAHLLDSGGLQPGFFIGGIPGNFKQQSARPAEVGQPFVIEGDEYDTSFFDKRSKFFHYLPEWLVINNLEFDHADIFNSLADIQQAFKLMLRQMPKNGLLLANADDAAIKKIVKHSFCPVVLFGTSAQADAQIKNIERLENAPGMRFTLEHKNEVSHWHTNLLGEFNVFNATAAILVAQQSGLKNAVIQQGLQSFIPPKKRLELLTPSAKIQLFVDFAHHPTSIRATLNALRQAYPKARLLAVYEACSFTATHQKYQSKLAESFDAADQVFLCPSLRQHSEEPLNLKQLCLDLQNNKKPAMVVGDVENLSTQLQNILKAGDVIVILSQADAKGLAQMLKTWILNL